MVKNIKPQELLKTEEFIREPVDNISKEIKNDPSKRIILTGGRGSGKSTILYNMENKSIGTEYPTIYTQFDSVINFSIIPNEIFNEIFFEHYYELCFSWNLLNYIKKNYVLTYDKYFKDLEILLISLLEELDTQIRNAHFNGLSLNRSLVSKEISSQILNRLKKYLNLSTLNLAVDRLDWTNGRSSYSQQIISKYFDLFDKTIITSDDERLENIEQKKYLKKQGYSFITANYGNNLEVIKQIIKKRIQLHNKNTNSRFDINTITDDIYTDLIKQTNGNITSMLTITNEVINLLGWHNELLDISSLFSLAANEELNKIKKLKQITIKPTLYL